MKDQFNATTFYTASGEAVPGSSVLPSQIDNGLSVGANLAVLLALTVATRLAAFAGIVAMQRLKRL